MQHDGQTVEVPVDAVLSSVALSELVLSLDPQPPQEIVEAAERLRYRSLCLVALVIDREEPFPDNWIYLHDPGIRAGRVQNFGAWSPDMVRPGRRASASNISASRATTSGSCRTRTPLPWRPTR